MTRITYDILMNFGGDVKWLHISADQDLGAKAADPSAAVCEIFKKCGQMTLSSTSILPRVALEYGQKSCAWRAKSSA